MRNIIAEFDANRFVRIHRSSIVNLSAISELNTSQYGEMELIMNDLKRLRVSKGYRKEFLLKMGIRK